MVPSETVATRRERQFFIGWAVSINSTPRETLSMITQEFLPPPGPLNDPFRPAGLMVFNSVAPMLNCSRCDTACHVEIEPLIRPSGAVNFRPSSLVLPSVVGAGLPKGSVAPPPALNVSENE